MTNELTTTVQSNSGGMSSAKLSEALERAITRNDFSQVSAEDRLLYLRTVCQSLNLNPLTMPLAYLTDRSGKVTLYIRKEGTEQLRRLHNVSLEIVSQTSQDGCYVVHVRASAPSAKGSGKRSTDDIGVVPIAGLKGELLANAMMKAVTKAGRRATLALCGLGIPDEYDNVEEEQQTASSPPATVKTVAAQPPALPAPERQQQQQEGDQLVAQEPVTSLPASAAPPTAMRATQEQLAELRRLKELCGIGAPAWLKILNKRGVGTARDLTSEQADELIHALQSRIVAQDLEQQANSSIANGQQKEPTPAAVKARGNAF